MKNIAMYLRLSLSDVDMGEDGKNESNSIDNQRLLIRNYLTAHPEITGNVIEYKDDGFTGTNFNRPAFRQMIDDAKKGYIGTIIVKDLSRFGRDYIGVGDYIEQVLPSLGVRLIAINSRYDSEEQGPNIVSLDVSISNMINTMYSRDLSRKLKASMLTKWKNGENPSRSAPYGYMTDKSDPTCRLIIDEEAADVVRKIFMLAISGYSTKEIAERLNAQDLLTPMLYKNKRFGYKISSKACNYNEQFWNTNMVVSILKCYDYTGARTHGKIERIGVGLDKYRTRDMHEWTIVENDHEPIVSKKVYEKAQKVIKKRGYRINTSFRNRELLAGKVRCACCGHMMHFDRDYQLFCDHAVSVGRKSKCSRDHYDLLTVENVVLSSLRKKIDLMVMIGGALKDKYRIIPSEKEAIDSLKDKIEKLNDDFFRQYENYANGNLKRDGFIAIKEEISSKRTLLESQIKELENSKTHREKLMFDVDRAVSLGKTVCGINDITRKVLDAFIEDIRINNSGEIEIRYMFEDLYDKVFNELQCNSE